LLKHDAASFSATGEPPTRGARGGIRPDIMILEGWPETGSPPGGATKTYKMRADKSKMKADESTRVTIIIGELGFSSDLGFQKTVDRKQHKYAPLIEELEREGCGTSDPRYT